MFSLTYMHYVNKFCTCIRDHWELAQKLVDKFVAKLMVLVKEHESGGAVAIRVSPAIQSYKQYCTFLHFINWFLSIAHHHIRLTEFQLEFLLNLIHRNCLQYSNSSTLAMR